MTQTTPVQTPTAAPESTSSRPPENPSLSRWWRRDARYDLPASMVVFLVAILLSLGIAAASDAPLAAGLIAAAVGGIAAGLVGGAPLQVSGPAAGLTVVVAEIVGEFGWEATCAITFAAGLLQIGLGAGRVGRFALAISPSVVGGMLAGIGISIVLGQVNVALGAESQPSAWENLVHLVTVVTTPDLQALLCATSVAAALVAWPRLPASARRVPAPLAAIVLVTVVAAVFLPDARRVDLGGSLLDHVGTLALPDGLSLSFAGAVLTVALIASVESLLSAVAVDKLHTGRRARLDRELVGQGLANTCSGALGGLPVTGVIVRSATNVRAGARTRASAVLHGVWVAVFSLLLVGLVEQIPLAALAGLLIVIGAQLVRPADVRRAQARGELAIYLLTVLGVLALNLVEGVLIGLAAALGLVLWRMSRVHVTVHQTSRGVDGHPSWVVDVTGTLSCLATPLLTRRLAAIPDGHLVEIDLLVDYLDPSARDHIEEWRQRYEARGGIVVVDVPGHANLTSETATKAAPLTHRTVLPWPAWQNGGGLRGADGSEHHPLALGIREFHRRSAPALRPVFEELRHGQSPQAVFLGCVDSRLVPNLVTSSGPGDLFTVRTMGNLVPDPQEDDGSVSAPLLYGVDHLDVGTVVVCGHSGCGAMGAVLDDRSGAEPVERWLRHARPSLESWRQGHPVGRAAAAAGHSAVDQLGRVNVAVMLDQLHAVLGEERCARVRLVGLFFAIEHGTLELLRNDEFMPLTDAELHEFGLLGTTGTALAPLR